MKAGIASAVVLLVGQCAEAVAVPKPTVAHASPAEHAVALKSVTVAAEHTTKGSAAKIVPPLVDVDTDKKFFGPPFPADYPHDIQPPQKKKLFAKGHMYPKVQEEGFFDKDYVKDENNDGGLWDAQMKYDNARTKVFREKKQAENAAKRASNEAAQAAAAAKEVARTKAEEAAAAEAAAKAKADADQTAGDAKASAAKRAADAKAKAEADAKADEEAAAAKRKAEREGMDKKVTAAEDALEKEKAGYKECLKQLKDAKAKVEQLEKEQEDLKNEDPKAPKLYMKDRVGLDAEKAAVAAAKQRHAEADAEHQAAAQKLAEAAKASQEAKKELETQKAESVAAEKKLAEEDKALKKSEQELTDAKGQLRKIRGIDATPGAGPKGPEQPKLKSQAPGLQASLTFVFALVAASALSP